MNKKKQTLDEILNDGGVIEYQNGRRGVRLKCGWWVRVLSKDDDGGMPERMPKPKKTRYTKKEKEIRAGIMAKRAADLNGDEWWDEWTDFCFKKVFGLPQETVLENTKPEL